jgi:hypothetical protein
MLSWAGDLQVCRIVVTCEVWASKLSNIGYGKKQRVKYLRALRFRFYSIY